MLSHKIETFSPPHLICSREPGWGKYDKLGQCWDTVTCQLEGLSLEHQFRAVFDRFTMFYLCLHAFALTSQVVPHSPEKCRLIRDSELKHTGGVSEWRVRCD